jgi:hypothetical protein
MQYFRFEMPLQDGIDTLLTLDAPQTGKCRANDYRLEMPAVTLYSEMATFKAGTDPLFNLLGCKHLSTP